MDATGGVAQNAMASTMGYGIDDDPASRSARVAAMYRRLAKKARVARFVGRLTGHSQALCCVAQAVGGYVISGRRDRGTRVVPMDRVIGSEGRCHDFDRLFRPLKTHTDQRWYHVAEARESGAELPPVALIQIGEDYYVRDGHHRISVARALGDTHLVAEVVEYELATRATPGLEAASPGTEL
jgi:hypothetical protein